MPLILGVRRCLGGSNTIRVPSSTPFPCGSWQTTPPGARGQINKGGLSISSHNQGTPAEEASPPGVVHVPGGVKELLGTLGGRGKAEDWNDILNRWYKQYQDFVGITDLKRAQDKVTELSEGLLAAQGERRRLQAEIEVVQAQLAENHQKITKTEQYSQEHMKLFSEARQLNGVLNSTRTDFLKFEEKERDTFTYLSSAIRDCHERERMQAEQSKYWSIIASVVSAALASVITSINNWVRIREIKVHVTESQNALLQGYETMRKDVVSAIGSPGTRGHDDTSVVAPGDEGLVKLEKIAANVKSLGQEMREFKKAMERFEVSFKAVLDTTATTTTTATTAATTATTPDEGVVPMPEVGYGKVAGTMFFGAACGTIITAFFLGAFGGAGG